MRTLMWVFAGFSVVMALMIPVSLSGIQRLREKSRPISGTILKVDEFHHDQVEGSAPEIYATFLVAFTDPFSGEEKELNYGHSWALTDADRTLWAVGASAPGFYMEGGDRVALGPIPEPKSALPMALISLILALISGLFWWLSRGK